MHPKTFIGKLLLAVLLVVSSTASAAERDAVPTKVTAERMTYLQDGNQAVFEGRVHVVRQDMELWAERIELDFYQAGEGQADAGSRDNLFSGGMGGQQVRRIVAMGNVRIRRGESSGQCEKATYLAQENMIILEGNPVLREGKNTLQGKEIRVYLGENRSEVIGNSKRPVEMIFVTPEKDSEKRQ